MGASVLVVDDDSGIRSALSDILRDEGFDVRVAANGLDALAQVAEREPDVVLLDLMMPVLDGWQVMESLRRHRRGLPIIVLSALPVRGCEGYVQKPLSLDRLLRLIDAVRAKSARRRRA